MRTTESDFGLPDSCELCQPRYVLADYEVWTEVCDLLQLQDLGEEGALCIRQLLCAACTAEHRVRQMDEDGLSLVLVRRWTQPE